MTTKSQSSARSDGTLRELLKKRAFILHARWVWDIGYGLALAVGLKVAEEYGPWIGIATVVIGLVTMWYAFRGK